MPRKKKSGAAAWVDPDDAPELSEKFFDRAEIRHGEKVIRRGRWALQQSQPQRCNGLQCGASPKAGRPPSNSAFFAVQGHKHAAARARQDCKQRANGPIDCR